MPLVLAAAPSVSGDVRACHDPAVLLQKRCRRPGPGRITPTLWLPAGPCSRMTKCQVVLALPVRAPEPDPPVLSLRKEAADIWAAAGAQKPTLGRGRAVPAEKSRSLPFSFCPPRPPPPVSCRAKRADALIPSGGPAGKSTLPAQTTVRGPDPMVTVPMQVRGRGVRGGCWAAPRAQLWAPPSPRAPGH